MTAGEIADRFACSWPTTTRHLAVLTDAGLLETGKQGRYRFYALQSALAMRAADWVISWANAERSKLDHATMRNAIPALKPDAAGTNDD